ncbi:MAG: class I SAM-dependent RNA methyltransferase [Syntrophales bacterium]|nr:class I SAM-dependent RNA methyltransferase [Syntrophales bacterium]
MDRYVECDITDVSYGGLGVGRIKGRVVFVPYTVTGDRVTVEIVQEKRNFSYGRLKDIIKPSPWRVHSPCSYYGTCGGCLLAHIDYNYQLEVKRLQVFEIFRRIGGYEVLEVEKTVPSPREWYYRGKMEFHGAVEERRGYVIGLRKIRGHEIVEVDRCLIAHESINLALGETRKKGKPMLGRLTFWADDNADSLNVMRHVKGHVFQVPKTSFFQANLYLVEKLVDLVLEMSELQGTETVIDAYCGVGLFSVFLARKARKTVGIEIDREAVEAARQNLERLFPGQSSIFQILHGEVGQEIGRLATELKEKVELIVVDPPRGGLSERVKEGIIKLGVQKIVYVSCNPSTMARDGAFFSRGGYRLTRLVPIDMFPQTFHVEVVGRWEKL